MNAICLFIKIRAFLCNHLFVNVELFCQIQRIKYTPLGSNFHCSPSKLQSQPSSSSKSRRIPPSESTLSTSTIDPSSTVTPRPKSKQSGGLFLPPVQKLVATLRCTHRVHRQRIRPPLSRFPQALLVVFSNGVFQSRGFAAAKRIYPPLFCLYPVFQIPLRKVFPISPTI